ncbi:hypothetical protein [Microvirga brassicacearum]|uniref:hypothetical protein n=1 Tax=Microvirga brassicacearum TaxID=2580413 RepID=UPI001293DAAC|nr:hypothetical protein [Microvirga brassicacearum]
MVQDSHEFVGVRVFRARTGITVDRKCLQVIVGDRNSPRSTSGALRRSPPGETRD